MEDQHHHRSRARLVVPTRTDALLRRWTEVLGGPLGTRTAPGVVTPGFFTVDRVLVLLTVAAALIALCAKSYCRINGWADSASVYYATCYSDYPAVLSGPAFAHGSLPVFTLGVHFEYPVLLSLLAVLTAVAVPGGLPEAQRVLAYFDLNALLVTGAWISTVLITARLARRRAWDAAMVALAPGIMASAFINWDMWAVLALAAAMLCFARRRPGWAGVWIGLGAAIKVYPVFLLVAVLIMAVRSGRLRVFAVTAGAAAASWLSVDLPFAVANPDAFRYFFEFSAGRGAGLSSVWESWNLIASRLGYPSLDATQVTVSAATSFLILLVAIVAVSFAAPRRPRLAQVMFLLVAAFVLCNKVYSPQYVLWLVPLVALARPVWRDFLLWQAVEVMHWAAVWMYLGAGASGSGPQHNIDVPYYVCAVLAHQLVSVYIMVRVAWDIMNPGDDAVRAGDVDDPQGGFFDGSPDRHRITRTIDRNRRAAPRTVLARPAPGNPEGHEAP